MTFTEWFLFFLAIQLIHGFGTWKLYKIAGFNPIYSFIPIYNGIILMKIINRPSWWIILLFIPIINLLIFPVIWVETSRSFGKDTSLDTLLTIITFGLFIYSINYSSKLNYIKDRNLNPKTALGEWVSSIIFAIVLATLVHTYFIQPYIIPTGSLEKSLLIGDFLFVSKFHYGARVPQSAVSFPMVHDTIVGTGIRSYLNKPQIPYFRLPGFQKITRNEIVTFSWPADTVRQFFVKEKGVKKPTDKKSNYVKRCVGIPSDTLEIINGIIHINGKISKMPYRAKPIYSYKAHNSKGVSSSSLIKLGLNDLQRKFKISDITQNKFEQIRPYILGIVDNNPNNFVVIANYKGIPYDVRSKARIIMTELTDYSRDLLLTEKEAELVIKSNILDSLKRSYKTIKSYNTSFFPNHITYDWNEDNFGPIIIPKKGVKVNLNSENLPLYKKLIRDYEKNELKLENGIIKIN
ncbi:MAG: signal peptidase I, partial [Flavobacteriaceae bacterium]|nr:signal peptidase I [Flavobacteriaceae bacterium]MBT5595591.1 signal peptidase I [Flavobacteriaceae bacterium]MBT5856725.1 signal peptidase I [Flavobacteriaceae bacterium]